MSRPATAALSALAVLAGCATAARAQDKPPVLARAEQCLRQHVDRVVADDPNVASAADFLVNYACAGEVAAASRYERNTAVVKMLAGIFKASATSSARVTTPPPASSPSAGAPEAAKPPPTAPAMSFDAKVDPETGELSMPPAGAGKPNPLAGFFPDFSNFMSSFAPQVIPVELRKLAGDLVLEARERRRARR